MGVRIMARAFLALLFAAAYLFLQARLERRRTAHLSDQDAAKQGADLFVGGWSKGAWLCILLALVVLAVGFVDAITE